MEFKNDIPTKEDKDFIVDDGYNLDEDPTYEPKDSSSSDDVLLVKSLKNYPKRLKNLVLNRLIIQHEKITNM